MKILELMKRKEGLTHEEFIRHWEEKHGPLVARVVPGISGKTTEKIDRFGHNQLSVFGIGAGQTDKVWRTVLRQLVVAEAFLIFCNRGKKLCNENY